MSLEPRNESPFPGHAPRRAVAALATVLALLASACSTTEGSGAGDPGGEPDPEIEAEHRELLMRHRRAIEQEQHGSAPLTPRLMLDLHQTLRRYRTVTYNSGSSQAENLREKLRDYLTKTVDRSLQGLIRAATDGSSPRNRAIALAALGFAEDRQRVMDPLYSGAMDADPEVSSSAVFGLAVLQAPNTRIGPLVRVMEDEERPNEHREGAAWALYRIQLVTTDHTPFVELWTEVLDGPIVEELDVITVQAVRGLGLTRDARHRELVIRYLEHPTPLVRMATAIALARLGDPAAAPALIELIGGAEPNQNVRLYARQALRELAGGQGDSYDVDEWRRIFDLGPAPDDDGDR